MKKASNSRTAPELPKDVARSILTGAINEDRGENNGNMLVCASNESRFNATNYSVELTGFTVGWTDPENLDDLLEFLAPACEVARRFTWRRRPSDEVFLSEIDDIRAIGSTFKRVEYSGEEVDARTYNKGLTVRVDEDEQLTPNWDLQVTGLLMQRLIRNDLRRAIALHLAAGNNTNVTWDENGNPDSDLRHMVRRTKAAHGLRANRVVMGGEGWETRLDSYEATPTNPSRFNRADRTPEQLARYLNVERVAISEAVYQSGPTAKSDIVGAIAIAFNARSGLSKDDPSNIKRFVTPTPTGRYRVFKDVKEKFTDITVEHYSNNTVTVAEGIEKITIGT